MDGYPLLFDTDSYKASHHKLYPKDVEWMMAYFESRGGEFDSTVFFGLQYYLKRYFTQVPSSVIISAAKTFYEKHGLPFNYDGWMHISRLGYYPLKIKAVPEGSSITKHNVLMTVESTDSRATWLVGWVETMLSRVWAPIAVATYSRECRKVINAALQLSSDDPTSEIDFKLHDFGGRGVSSQESAAILGMAHLLNFNGSDTVAALVAAQEYYDEPMAGFSIPATEHSTICSWGRDNEREAYANVLKQFPGQMVACVSDSYDLGAAISDLWGGSLMAPVHQHGRDGGVLVIRPDSGDPVETTLDTLNRLNGKFYCQNNSKGFKVLPPYLRVIYGDGIDINSIMRIYGAIHEHGYSSSNIAFGSGGALLQRHTRDTHKMAYKVCAVSDGKTVRGVYKDPVGDPGKRSRGGILDLNSFGTLSRPSNRDYPDSLLRTVFRNGEITTQSFAEIRARARDLSTGIQKPIDSAAIRGA